MAENREKGRCQSARTTKILGPRDREGKEGKLRSSKEAEEFLEKQIHRTHSGEKN